MVRLSPAIGTVGIRVIDCFTAYTAHQFLHNDPPTEEMEAGPRESGIDDSYSAGWPSSSSCSTRGVFFPGPDRRPIGVLPLSFLLLSSTGQARRIHVSTPNRGKTQNCSENHIASMINNTIVSCITYPPSLRFCQAHLVACSLSRPLHPVLPSRGTTHVYPRAHRLPMH